MSTIAETIARDQATQYYLEGHEDEELVARCIGQLPWKEMSAVGKQNCRDVAKIAMDALQLSGWSKNGSIATCWTLKGRVVMVRDRAIRFHFENFNKMVTMSIPKTVIDGDIDLVGDQSIDVAEWWCQKNGIEP